MKGYWNQEDATTEAIRGGWLFTGDLGYQDEDGYIYLAGRAKDFIKRGGEMVSPEEVEQVLQSHDAIEEAAIIGVPDLDWGERVRAIVRAERRRIRERRGHIGVLPPATGELQEAGVGGVLRGTAAQPDGQGAEAAAEGRV